MVEREEGLVLAAAVMIRLDARMVGVAAAALKTVESGRWNRDIVVALNG